MKSIIDYIIQYLRVILNEIPQYDEFTKPINHRKKELTSITYYDTEFPVHMSDKVDFLL